MMPYRGDATNLPSTNSVIVWLYPLNIPIQVLRFKTDFIRIIVIVAYIDVVIHV